ncbi:MAG: cupin domain-containing protein [Pirellulaceae bacterium]|nr:cupin domain-containing protein [Pirellulaceae bacterium]|tara:strand:+ start:206 stop:586 length:381 start_codon:yes stop_codon:yes gene_type:complete
MEPSKSIVHRSSGNASAVEQFGPYKIEALLSETEEVSGTVYRVFVDANQTTRTSYHQIAEEFYFVLSGVGTAILDGSQYPIKPGDFLRLPPGTRHAFVTLDEPLEMLDIHVPGSRPGRDAYFVEDE